ncbi:DUF3221 domain-containing protein [Pontibacter mangrovi]|uniref:DUF3221 domain-containing protein n=1 Tax=Pontibacter mangrovi TaxID=2589816 RepID=A0A501W5G4_9BACT|nr:DUF3221 domain-containing protein [Pontibacter mangrovi]TPE43520.1 DUF3221 domain-containing protein [Pontibacter mangrovi]
MKNLPLTLCCLLLAISFVSCRQEPKRMPDTLPDVYGYITDIKRTASNGKGAEIVIAVRALEGVEATYADASIKIDKHTLVEDESGERFALERLREGQQVQAWFNGDVLATQPVQGTAIAMRISH